jgi:hypothetical protein
MCQGDLAEVSFVLGCGAASLGNCFLMFRVILMAARKRVKAKNILENETISSFEKSGTKYSVTRVHIP